MVYFLHSANDTAAASRDVARIYATKTLGGTGAVSPATLNTILIDVLVKGMRVAVPSPNGSQGRALHTLIAILRTLKHPVSTVDEYLNSLQPFAPQAAPQLPSAVAEG